MKGYHRYLSMFLTVFVLSFFICLNHTNPVKALDGTILPMSSTGISNYIYRFYSPVFKGHFYTNDWNEGMQVANYDSNWIYEGTIGEGFYDAEPDSIPIYRFWSPVFQGHFYTADYDEMIRVRDLDRNWEYEGVAYFAYPTDTLMGSEMVYRFWSPIYKHHFYTTDYSEVLYLVNNDPAWSFEGEAYKLPIVLII